MSEVFIRVDGAGQHQCYRSLNGTVKHDVGPPFASPREAMAYAESIDPLRPSAMDSTAVGVAPLRKRAGVESIADVPRGRRGRSGG